MNKVIRQSSVLLSVVLVAVGCKDLSPEIPAGSQDPGAIQTADGALSQYRGALRIASETFTNFMLGTGLFTDEIFSYDIGNPSYAGQIMPGIDGRNNDAMSDQLYGNLHTVRANTVLANAALKVYAPESAPSLRGELLILQGFANIMLADFYCSGIPLSVVEYDGGFTYAPGSTTAEVYQTAIALFDSALVLSTDSARVMNLARIGKGRALLALGKYPEAAATVADVPDGYRYALPIVKNYSDISSFFDVRRQDIVFGNSVSDSEGENGLPFRSSHDPRSTVRTNGILKFINDSVWVPLKYDFPFGTLTLPIADAVEARLIQAEADLHSGGMEWLSILNALRTNGTFVVTQNPENLALNDTTWNAGTGGVAGLKPLDDPGAHLAPSEAMTARVDLLFAERGYWLFLTGHRQGDLRRLIRQYERVPDTVYPTGAYGPNGLSLGIRYGSDVTLQVPLRESQLNHLYTGCFDRDA